MGIGSLALAIALVGAHVTEAQDSVPTGPTHSADGHARVQPEARIVGGDEIRFRVLCPGGGSQSCQGRAAVETRSEVAVRRRGQRRIVTLGSARFEALSPGESVSLTARVRREARYHVRRHRRIAGLGRVANELPSQTVPTVDPLTVRNPRAGR